MSIFEKSRFKVFNSVQHPLRHTLADFGFSNPVAPGVSNIESALNYIFAVLYPNYIGTFATTSALPGSSSANDYAFVTDDGDGKSAGYVWQVIDAAGKWVKRYDVDWSLESILAETINRTQYQYVMKFGMSDLDPATGSAYTAGLNGQHIFGGDADDGNLTLHANSGAGASTGFVQVTDIFRPTADGTIDLGEAGSRWATGYFDALDAATLDTSGAVTVGGNLTVTGAASASNLSGTNTGDLTLAAIGSTPNANGATLTGQALNLEPASASFGGVITTGAQTLAGAKTFNGAITAALGTGTGLAVTADATVGGDLTVTGTLTAGNLSGANTGDLTLAAVGSAPAAEGASLAGQVLTLQPADGTHPGVITTGAQTIAGSKTWSAAAIFSSTGTALTVDNDATITGALQVGSLTDGTNSIAIANLLTFRAANGSSVGDSLFWDGAKWVASAPDTEITHSSISGLTTGDAGHTQFAMLAGRSGGQSLQGGTGAGENLTLESTSNASKGAVLTKDNLTPAVTASYSAGWSGTDLGDATHAFRDIYTKGEFKGFRLENLAAPANSAQNVGRAVYDSGVIKVDSGLAWISLISDTGAQSAAGVKTWTSNALFTALVGVGSGPITPNVEMDILGALATRRSDVASASSISSLATATSYVKITGALSTSVLGVASGFDGKRVVVHNTSSGSLTIKHQDAGATAADRVITPTGSDLVVLTNRSTELIYDAAQSRWVVASSGAGGGSYTTTAVQNVGASGTISSTTYDGFQMRRVQGSGGAQTASSTPFASGGGWTDGTVITLLGQSDTNTLTVLHNDAAKGCILNGDAVLGNNSILSVMYDATADRWVQLYRSNC